MEPTPGNQEIFVSLDRIGDYEFRLNAMYEGGSVASMTFKHGPEKQDSLLMDYMVRNAYQLLDQVITEYENRMAAAEPAKLEE